MSKSPIQPRKAAKTRERILQAASAIIAGKGVHALTLELAAAEAGVSKGGLLYHFKGKDQLTQALLQYSFDMFELDMARHAAQDARPGAWLRGYIRASFPIEQELHRNAAATAASLMASLGRDPQLNAIYAQYASGWHAKLREEQIDPDLALVVRMAVDGLWMSEALGLGSPEEGERAGAIDRLMRMTELPERE
ncbi:TetR/AcrR family transcriptional regulator (plasmid) [Massilia varians]